MTIVYESIKERDEAIEQKRKLILSIVKKHFSEQLPAGREASFSDALAAQVKELQELIAGEVEAK